MDLDMSVFYGVHALKLRYHIYKNFNEGVVRKVQVN
jgi:hypothetical protein